MIKMNIEGQMRVKSTRIMMSEVLDKYTSYPEDIIKRLSGL